MLRKLTILGAIASVMLTAEAVPKKKKQPTDAAEEQAAKKKSDDNNNPVLRGLSGGKYKILQFTDLHFGEDNFAD